MRHNHDEAELDLLPLLVDPTREAIDVGANVGRYASRLTDLATHVHVFEPHPRLARMLARSLPANCTVYQSAVSDQIGETRLHIPVMSGRPDEGLAFVDARPSQEQCINVNVETMPLDRLTDFPIGFIKIDVEGHEWNVLCGASELICRHRPIVLVEAEERHRANALRDIADFFEVRQYKGVFYYDSRLIDISKFSSDFQDIALLSNTKCFDRKKVNYVNNFIFLPRENDFPRLLTCGEVWRDRCYDRQAAPCNPGVAPDEQNDGGGAEESLGGVDRHP